MENLEDLSQLTVAQATEQSLPEENIPQSVVTHEAEFASQDALWDEKRPSDWETGEHNILFVFADDGDTPDESSGWFACFEVRAKHIPQLMRRGFHWSLENLLQDQGTAMQAPAPHGRQSLWKYQRCYFLQDSPDDPEWTATMRVYSQQLSVLASFKLEWLTRSAVVFSRAKDWDDVTVYEYHDQEPECSFNTIYEDMPLQGLWPWPKAPSKS